MSTPVVLIPAPSRALDEPRPWPSRKKVRESPSPAVATKQAKNYSLS
jgi:hypothetical protein